MRRKRGIIKREIILQYFVIEMSFVQPWAVATDFYILVIEDNNRLGFLVIPLLGYYRSIPFMYGVYKQLFHEWWENTHPGFTSVLDQITGIEKIQQLREIMNFLKDKRMKMWGILQLDIHKKAVDFLPCQ